MADTESALIRLIATDRIDVPISSMSGKLKRRKPVLAGEVDFPGKSYSGERTYARVTEGTAMKARGMREGVDAFKEAYPKYGEILEGMIAEEREVRQTYLHFGMQEGRRLSSQDYMDVMADLGFTPERAEMLYGELMQVSRNMKRKRGEDERSILLEQHI